MGEYAFFGNELIKIGTCNEMFYLRYDDRMKVTKDPHSLDARTESNLYWRLPFPDEDFIPPGGYEKYNRGEPLIGFDVEGAEKHTGIIQVSHDCGILMTISCHHGKALPESHDGVKIAWNGKAGWFWELTAVKNTKDGIKAVVSCRFCRTSWLCEISEVLEYVKYNELKARLKDYQDML